MANPARLAGGAIAWGVYGSIGVGVVGVLAAVLLFSSEPLAAAVCLLASAASFGLLANAVLRQ